MGKKENFNIYMPEIKSMGEKLPLTFKLLVRIETPLKLNLRLKDGSSLISEGKELVEEVHFVAFESVIEEFELSFGTVFKLMKELVTRKRGL